MGRAVRLIVAESNPSDAQLISEVFRDYSTALSLMDMGEHALPEPRPVPRLVPRSLGEGGWEIRVAQSLPECMELLGEPTDLLLLDAKLSDAGSAELLQQIKQAHPQLPVIMVLPPGAEAELEGTRAMRQSAHSYVTKSPGWESRLPLMVDRWLQGAQAHKDVQRAASELSALRQHYQTILAYTREALLALNPAGFIVHFSPTAERILGYSASEVIGEHISVFYDSPESIRTILAILAETDNDLSRTEDASVLNAESAENGTQGVRQRQTPEPDRAVSTDEIAHLPGILRVIAAHRDVSVAQARSPVPRHAGSAAPSYIQYEAFLRHAEGHFLIFEVTMAAVHDEDGELTGYLSFCHELTEERQAQRELLRAKSLLQTIMDTAPVNILIVGAAGNIVSANNNIGRSLGYMVQGLIGEQAAMLTTEPEKLREVFERTLETGEPQQAMLEVVSADGETQAHQAFTALMHNSQGEATGIITITTDLSGHKRQIDALRAEIQQLQADEGKARALFETAASLAATDDLYGVFGQIAQSAATHLGFDEITVYRADHEQGLLVGVVTAEKVSSELSRLWAGSGEQRQGERAGSSGLVARSHIAELRALSNVNISLTAGEDPLADFALGSEPYKLLPSNLGPPPRSGDILVADTSVVSPRSAVLVQMRAPGEDSNLVGIISATFPAEASAEAESAREGEALPPAARFSPLASKQVHLLCSLARLASVANERARMERLRSQLISSVSHELRTPLAAIRAYNELLLDGDAGPINDEQRLFLSRIEATSMQLNRILDDLLDLSRMRAGELSVHRATTDVAACIQYIINTAQPEAGKKHITVESRILSELPPIVTDPDRLSQVLMNLVDNAIKYGNEGGSVLVEARVGLPPVGRRTEREAGPHRRVAQATSAVGPGAAYPSRGDELVISVADNGPGIPPDDLDKIFDEFQRGSHAAARRAKGAGLGLAIVSRLVRLLGGAISVDSTVGEGSTFYLRFPLAHLTAGDE